MDTANGSPGAGNAAPAADTSATPAAHSGTTPAAPSETKATPTQRDTIGDAVSRALKGAEAPPPLEDAAAGGGSDDDEDDDAEAQGAAGGGEGEGEDEGAEGAGEGEGEGANASAEDELTPPAGLTPKATERFTKLVERVKEGEQKFTELHGKFTGIEQTLKSTGATPEQWGQVLTAMRYGNSGDPTQARMALQILDNYRAEIARVAGVPVQGVDVLGDFPDLRAKVDNGDLDEASAAEIAASRRFQERARTQDQAAQQQAQQRADVERRQTAARDELSALGTELQAKDIDYPRKIELLKERGFFEDIVANVQPEHWKSMFQKTYDALGAAASSNRTPAPNREDAPLRPSGKSNSSGKAQPKSIADAVRMAVNED